MKKEISIRLFICLAFGLVCCMSYVGGYYFGKTPSGQEVQGQETVIPLETEKPEILESGVSVEPYQFLLKEEDGYVIVYYSDGTTQYDITDIPLNRLSDQLQREIRGGKSIKNQEELYNFLESYSS